MTLKLFCVMKINTLLLKAKQWFLKIAKAEGSVDEIAMGAAIGTFVSVFPTFGFGFVFVLFLYRFYKFNLIAATSTSVISNPFTSPFFMLISYKIGSFVLGNQIVFDVNNWRANLKDTSLALILGSTIVSTTLSIAAYFVFRFAAIRLKQQSNN